QSRLVLDIGDLHQRVRRFQRFADGRMGWSDWSCGGFRGQVSLGGAQANKKTPGAELSEPGV
ncbi:MAG: hypothetical protein AAFY56_15985, partial [Pseudomonadota bacterium]